jgi:FKBP-type peptidyl-prolyl cis-trans isomerase SlyD
MKIAQNKVVSFDYVLKDTNDEILDISGAAPMVYLHGHKNIIPGLENALEGKSAGESFKVTIPAKEAYGEWDQNLVTSVPRSSFDGVKELEEGMEFEAQFPDGAQIVKVIKVTETEVTVDGNHPLAGTDLKFELTIREIRDASQEEIACGHVHHEHGDCDGCGAGDGCGGECGCS